ncbi:MAG: cytochrome C [Hyphomicrobiales bacterium]|nr:cytochrome C [Hyphomicrobiales bacterium]
MTDIIRISCRLFIFALCGAFVPQSASASGLGYDGPPAQEICALCHSVDGVSRMSKFPRLAGQRAEYIEKQLEDFLSGDRSNDGGQMSAIVTEIETGQFKDVAAYFSSLKPPPPISLQDGRKIAPEIVALVDQGDAARAIPACASCHFPHRSDTPSAESENAPYLTSQHADYLAKQLRDFRSGERINDKAGIMTTIANSLEDSEIEELATYLASLPRTGEHER